MSAFSFVPILLSACYENFPWGRVHGKTCFSLIEAKFTGKDEKPYFKLFLFVLEQILLIEKGVTF